MDSPPDLAQRIVDLECRLAFLEEELSQKAATENAVHLQLAKLEDRLEALVKTVREQRGTDVGPAQDEPPPPHH